MNKPAWLGGIAMTSKYTYEAADIGPSWELMKQDLPEHRRTTDEFLERFDKIQAELAEKEQVVAEEHDLKLAMRSREKQNLAIQIIEWAMVIVFVVLSSWFVGQWFYNSLH